MRTRVAATVLAAFAGTLVLAGSVAAGPSGGGHSGGHGGGGHGGGGGHTGGGHAGGGYSGGGYHGGGGSHAVPRSGYGGHGGYYGGGHGYYRGGGHGSYYGHGHGYYGHGHGYYGHGYYPYYGYGYGYYPYYGYYPWWGFGLGLSFYYDNAHYDAPYAYPSYDPSYGVYAPSGEDQGGGDQYADRDDRVTAPPRDMARPAGELRLTVRPSDASVYVDGEFRGTAARLETLWLPPGRHRLEVVRPGFRTYDRSVDISREAPTSVDVQLER